MIPQEVGLKGLRFFKHVKKTTFKPSPSHLSDTILIKYCGGRGSNTGTKNFSVCSSEANLLFSRKYSWCKMISLSTSSTNIHIASEFPWTFSSHWKSGVITSSTLRVDLTRKTCWSGCIRIKQHKVKYEERKGKGRNRVSHIKLPVRVSNSSIMVWREMMMKSSS